MKNNKYPDGYMPKIKYYADIISKVAKSQRALDTNTLDKGGINAQIDLLVMLQDAALSLDYFISKEHMRLNLKK
jgi:hypothetical protein